MFNIMSQHKTLCKWYGHHARRIQFGGRSVWGLPPGNGTEGTKVPQKTYSDFGKADAAKPHLSYITKGMSCCARNI